MNYNGWTNYPTWCVNLWIGNDEGLSHEAERKTRAAVRAAANSEPHRKASHILADDLAEWVKDELLPDLGTTFAADLLGYAIGEVDWHEIAKGLLDA